MDRKVRKTKELKLGQLKIGGNNPVYIQSMPKIKANDEGFIPRVKKMVKRGCDILRIAVRSKDNIENLKEITDKVSIPLIADIHFNYKLALQCIKTGVDGIRLNPANIYKEDHIKAVIKEAKKYHIPIRVGVNSGSLVNFTNIAKFPWVKNLNQYIKKQGENNLSSVNMLIKLAMDYVNFLETLDFNKIMISIKSKNVLETIKANQRLSALCDYPLHIGITTTGLGEEAVVKSSIGIGTLLSKGIGNVIRVSLTSDPFKEIEVAKNILSSLNLRKFGPEIISCPTCGRTQLDVINMANELKKELINVEKDIRIAIMGCEVNGPGEATQADIGIAGAGNSVLLFRKGKKIKKMNESDAIGELLKYIKDIL